eukprot:TRINITY_DN7553_c0_g1_i1.p1 TRINITY_DN7553_c0_g1~~TRINITY_DN7553_c0_g1_i1.p1  ORF type:complete len:54 (+),score=6.42 TRINITY_DN7553_c0_g1_i1:500-661(+)
MSLKLKSKNKFEISYHSSSRTPELPQNPQNPQNTTKSNKTHKTIERPTWIRSR